MKGIDCATPINKAAAKQLAEEGYAFAARYLVPAGYAKRLTGAEVQYLTDAGLLVMCVFETTADRAKGGAKNGAADGAKAFSCAREIFMPESGCIYFAVDFGAANWDMDNIEAYLRAAGEQIGAHPLGVYGSYYVIEEMHRRGVCDRYWQCVGWSGGQVSEHLDVYQYAWGKKAAGISVDFNEAKTLGGMWNYLEEDGEMFSYEKFKEYMARYEEERAALEPGAWSQEARDWAERQGIIRGDEHGNKRYRSFLTREEYAVTEYRQVQDGK
jgi:hypothetical protein